MTGTRSIPFHLDDGWPVVLRPVVPDDKPRFTQAWEQLSPDSRYLRFFSSLKELSPKQLRFFTEVDQVNHVAWCVLDASNPHYPGVGVGRYVRLAEQPDVADFALTVVDPYQHRGVGRLLLAALYLAAGRNGISELRGEVLWHNHRLRHWLLQLGATLTPESDCDVLHLPVRPLDQLRGTPSADRFAGILRELIARSEEVTSC